MNRAWASSREMESHLSDFRLEKGMTIRELCAAAGVNPASYPPLNSGMLSPITRTGEIRPSAAKLAEYLGADLSDLWPMYFCGFNHPEIGADEILERFHPGYFSEEYSDPAEIYERNEARGALSKLLLALSPRERMVLSARLENYSNGLAESFDPAHNTLDDIASRFGVSRERIRQLERRAIGRLQLRQREVKEAFYTLCQ